MIRDYVATGNAADKAGAYGVQEVGNRFIAEVAGDLTNVIGLPLGRLLEGLRRVAGLDPARGKSLAQVVRAAFPALESFPGENWLGIPD
ncbi:Maf family protein [Candidatus Sumerlaeota bacterium]|nr:Maf family protein [Candidatus Sumerlaeota bacterium]